MNTYARKTIFILIWLVIWQVFAVALNNPWLFASPVQVATSLLQLTPSLEFWTIVASTLLSIFGSFALSAVCGIILGIVCSRLSIIEEFLSPAIHVIKSAPVVCIIAILLVALGSYATVVVVVALVVFPQYFYATLHSRQSLSPMLLRLARVYNVSAKYRFLCIDLAGLIPNLSSTSKSAVGMAWKSGVAAELIGLTSTSIGEAVYLSKVHLDVSAMIAWTLVVIVFAWITEKLVVFALDALAGLPKRYLSLAVSRALSRCNNKLEAHEHIPYKDKVAGATSIPTLAVEYHYDCLVPRETNRCFCTLELEGVDVNYGSEQVFDSYNLVIDPGEAVCLMAPSGSGKTTLLSVIDKSISPTNGTVNITSYEGDSPSLSVMFQDSVLLEWASAKENIAFVAGNDSEIALGIKFLEDILPADSLNKPVSELSGGQRRRVDICRALAHPSCAILLDEPFSGLDADTKLQAISLIKEAREGRTLIVATHDENDAEALDARIVNLD